MSLYLSLNSSARLKLKDNGDGTGTLYSETNPYSASNTTITNSANVTTASVKILGANAARRGMVLYNNSANSGYVAFGSTANSANNMSFIVATFTSLVWPQGNCPNFTGDVYAIRNAGTGAFICTEFT